jgi:cyclohexanecarboxylate-CoA ligase
LTPTDPFSGGGDLARIGRYCYHSVLEFAHDESFTGNQVGRRPRETVEQVRRLAAGLFDLGIRRGEVVAVQLPNVAKYLIAYFAITWLGAVMTTLYVPCRAREMETQLGHSRARAIVCADALGNFEAAETALALRDKLPDLEHVIALGSEVPGSVSFDDLMAHDPIDIPGPAPAAADPFLLLFTSGTTDAPKGVPLTSHAILGNARLCAPIHGIGPEDVVLSAPPFGHLFALYAVHLALAVGACSHLLPTFTPPALAEVLQSARPTVVLAAAAHIAVSAPLLDDADLSALRLVILSGSTVSHDLATRLDEMLDGGAVTLPDDPIDIIASSAGRPSPGAEVRILDAAGTEAPVGQEGELQVRGPSLFPGLAGQRRGQSGRLHRRRLVPHG